MYEEHFSLSRKPFASFPEPDMLYWGEGHKLARTMLIYGISSASGIVVVTGEIGTGKTTLLNHLLNTDGSGHMLGRLTGAMGLGTDVTAWVLYGFGMEPGAASPTENMDRFHTWLSKLKVKRRKAILFIDEAQLLPDHVIEELRLLADMQVKGEPVLQLVLLGQTELGTKLNLPEHQQFRQRIISHYHLKGLGAEETVAYARNRLEKADAPADLFTAAALEALHPATDGVPRRINILCDTALVYAFGEGEKQITPAILNKVLADRQRHGTLELS